MHPSFYPQQHFHNHYRSTMCKSTPKQKCIHDKTVILGRYKWPACSVDTYSFVSDRCVYLIITEAAFEIWKLKHSRELHIVLGTEQGWKHSAPSPQGISIITHPKVVLWAFWKPSLSSITYRTIYGRIGISITSAFFNTWKNRKCCLWRSGSLLCV